MARAKTPAEILSRIPLFAAFTDFTPTVPKLYWDVYSQEERIKAICEALDKLVCYANKMGIQINLCEEEIEKLYNEFEDFKAGAFDDYYVAILEAWINNHMPEIISKSIKMIFFGLTDDGYFCAYIPQSWSDLMFDTGYDYGWYDYGRLKILFEPEGFGVIDNTGTNIGMYEELKAKIEALDPESGDIEELKQRVNVLASDLTTETTNRTVADEQISGSVSRVETELSAEVTARTASDTAINARIDAIDISEIESDITALQSNVSTNTTNITNLTSRVTTAEADIDEMQETLYTTLDQ